MKQWFRLSQIGLSLTHTSAALRDGISEIVAMLSQAFPGTVLKSQKSTQKMIWISSRIHPPVLKKDNRRRLGSIKRFCG